ncbi:MAG: hypothetical protein ACI9F9_002873 [Candidatus Paceibacteria bacterium]|jgi:hypothetical protein
MSESLHWILFAAAIQMVLSLVCLLALGHKHRRTVGALLLVQRPSTRMVFYMLPLALALFIASLRVGGAESSLLLVTVMASSACLWLWYQAQGAHLGALGARIGWRSRRFEDFEEWRLTGQHARFCLGGQWLALDVSGAQQASLRKQLEACCPERESAFKD